MISPPRVHVEFDGEVDQYKSFGKWFDTWEEAVGYAEDCVESWWESRYETLREDGMEGNDAD